MARVASIVAVFATVALGGVANAALVVPPPIAVSETDLWLDLTLSGLGGGPSQSIAPATLDTWAITITNTSAAAWSGFQLRFSQDAGGEALNFVTHFEPRFTSGPWNGGTLLIDDTFAFAAFDAATAKLDPLAPNATVVLQVPLFNLSDTTQLYHLQINAISTVPAPAGAGILAAVLFQRRRRSARA